MQGVPGYAPPAKEDPKLIDPLKWVKRKQKSSDKKIQKKKKV